MLRELIQSTAWECDIRPYGAFHLIFWSVGLAVCLPLAYVLAKRLKNGRVLLLSVGAFLLITEVYKQIFYTEMSGGYRYDMLPFQLCSVPMYICIAQFFAGERLRRALLGFLASYGFMGGFVSYFAPGTMCRPYLLITVHSFLWHMLLIFVGAYAGLSMRPRLRDFWAPSVIYVSLAGVAFAINCLLVDKFPHVNMFYVGPHDSPIIICRDICARYGWQVNTLLYTLALTACAFAFYVAFSLICKRLKKTSLI